MTITINYPLTVVDNFFPDPDKIRDFGLKQKYIIPADFSYPGKRTECLSKINPQLYAYIVRMIVSAYYDLDKVNIYSESVTCSFQLIDGSYGDGFVHSDDCPLSAIIYLDKDNIDNSGTSLFKHKTLNFTRKYVDQRNELWRSKEPVETVNKINELHNQQFIETVTVQNEYNRLIAFDGFLPHRGNTSGSMRERLTITAFFHELPVSVTPYNRIQRYGVVT